MWWCVAILLVGVALTGVVMMMFATPTLTQARAEFRRSEINKQAHEGRKRPWSRL